MSDRERESLAEAEGRMEMARAHQAAGEDSLARVRYSQAADRYASADFPAIARRIREMIAN